MVDVLIDAIIDSLKVFLVVVIVHILLSFLEHKISHSLEKNKKISPILGALFGLVPQCGFSVIASDLYIKNHITMGTIIAVFIACSDEALPLLLSDLDKIYMVIPLIVIKFVLAISVGLIVDCFIKKEKESVHEHLEHCEHEEEIHVGCCNHQIDNEKESKIKMHLLHPLIHSLKIFLYILIVNLVFGLIIFYVGEDKIANFLMEMKYFGPLFSVLIGLIPNCASSIIITELFLLEKISFGTTLAGLIVNAGLGMMILFKNKNIIKKTLIILLILIVVALIAGYVTCLIAGF